MICDGHPAHRCDDVTDFATENDVKLVYSPPYSSCMSPIEKCWNVMKRGLRQELADLKAIGKADWDFKEMLRRHCDKLASMDLRPLLFGCSEMYRNALGG